MAFSSQVCLREQTPKTLRDSQEFQVVLSIDAVVCICHSGCNLVLARRSLYSISTLYSHFLMNACFMIALSVVFIHYSMKDCCFTITTWLFLTWMQITLQCRYKYHGVRELMLVKSVLTREMRKSWSLTDEKEIYISRGRKLRKWFKKIYKSINLYCVLNKGK